MTKGWHGKRQAHSLASKGIKSKYQYNSSGKPKLTVGLPDYTRERVKHITDLSDGKEWIAELKLLKEDIIIDDIQISESLDQSFLHWNDGDEETDVGYIHYHPPELIPEFSAQDFVLAINVHEMRKNKEKYPYTLMGLVYPEKDKLKIVIYGINPKKGRKSDFEGKMVVESDLKDVLDEMVENKELLKMRDINERED